VLSGNSIADCQVATNVAAGPNLVFARNQIVGVSRYAFTCGYAGNMQTSASIRDNVFRLIGGDVVAGFAGCGFDIVGNLFDTVGGRAVGQGARVMAFNTFYKCRLGSTPAGQIFGNIFAQGADVALSAIGNSTSYNLFFNNNGDGVTGANAVQGVAPSALDPSNIFADPQFVDAANGDFTPGANAVDHGVDLGIDRNADLPGNFNGAAPDIGAVETP
jgi:hypothetical protein